MSSVVPAMWDMMSSWFTPTTLFLFLNFTILTIYVTSVSASPKPTPPPSPTHQTLDKHDSQEDLRRTTSVLQRLKSVNFYQYANYYRSHESAPPTTLMPETKVEFEPAVFRKNQAEDRFEVDEEEEEEPEVYPSEEAEDRFNEEEMEDEVEVGDGDGDGDGGERSLDEVYRQLQRGSHNRSKSDMEPASGAVAAKLVKRIKKSASSKSTFRHFKEADILEARRPATVKEAKTAAEEEDVEVDSKADDFINKFKQQLQIQRLDSILRYKEMLGRGAQK